ncbi:MAG TPA: carbohydrate ABC transporter permease [Candidatus Limnocylindrales bacterium]|nr:carbohydrate ABC transporter permease [Candidatus Limnocylindrales bacterium]
MATSASGTTESATTRVGARPEAGARRLSLSGLIVFGILVLVAVAILFPLVYAVLGGFKTNGQLASNPAAILPTEWVFTNYTDVLFGAYAPTFWRQALNSVIVAAVALVLTVSLASGAAFVFARMVFRGREAFYLLFVFGLLFPSAVAILPLYILIRELGLSANLLGVALPQAAFALPLTIVILRPFFRNIPAELEDAARIDGCGTFGFFWRILLPLARPALATVSVLAIVTTWNAFFLPLVILNGADQWTLPLGAMNFSTEYSSDKARVLAYTVVTIIPAIVFYAVAERHIVSGLTSGSVKG